MKKLKIILPLFLFMMLLAFVVNAENCDTDKISISSITLKDKSDNVTEGNKASVNDKNIKLDLNMLKLGANVEYEIVVNNESDADYELDKSSFNFNSDYVYYSISSNDESNIVKANSTKTINLKVEYKNENLFSWIFRWSLDSFVYAETFLERAGAILGYVW